MQNHNESRMDKIFQLCKEKGDKLIDFNNEIVLPGFEINKLDEHGNTCLHYACEYSNFLIMNTLLSNDQIQLDIVNKSGFTAFHLACQNESITEAALLRLLDAGADPAQRDFVSLQNGLHLILQNSSFKVTTNVIKKMIEKDESILYALTELYQEELTEKEFSCFDFLLGSNTWNYEAFSYIFSKVSTENFNFFINELKKNAKKENCLSACISYSDETGSEEKNQKWDMLKLMLKTMAEKNIKLKDLGDYYCGEMLYESCLVKKIDNEFIDSLHRLQVNFQYHAKNKNTCLHALAEGDNDDDNVLDLRVVNRLMENGGVKINNLNSQKLTCLYIALQSKSYLLAFYFILKGARITNEIKANIETLFMNHTDLLGHALYDLIKKMMTLTAPEQQRLITRYNDALINQFSITKSFQSFHNQNPKKGIFTFFLALRALPRHEKPEKRIPAYVLPRKDIKIKISDYLLKSYDRTQCTALVIQDFYQNNTLQQFIRDFMPDTPRKNNKRKAYHL